MPNLTAKISLIEDMSEKMSAIAESGQSALDSMQAIGTTADSSMRTASSSADGVATALSSVSSSANEAAAATNNWTSAVGGYDKSALEALYTTEELVGMGLKSADALSEQDAMFTLCEQSAERLTQSLEATTEIEAQLTQAQEEAAKTAEALANADGVSTEAKEEYSRAVEEAAEAMAELQRAQEEANSAMENYDAVLTSGTTDLQELEAAAERAGHAAENLAEANGRASTAAEELSKATETAGEELEKSGNKGTEAITELESILATAGITAMLKEMAEAAYELADAFSEAEKTVVLATGATGDALADLEGSMMSVYSTAKSTDLSSTAGAVGEVNTRLGLTGERLEEVTGQFLDYANVTGQNVVPSISSVTQLMNQWDVELDKLPGLLDNLTYAGQISGKNVANLTSELVTNKGVLQALGFSLEDSIGLFAELELQGVGVQTAMTGFRTALNNFADEGVENTTEALQEVIGEIVSARTESEATAIAVENFGSRAGAALASSIRSGTLSIEDLSSALDGAEGALETTAEASQTMSEKLQQAGNNTKTAFTVVLQPSIDKVTGCIANMMNGFADFLKENPTITKAITALAIAAGVFTAALVAYKAATVAATIAQAAFNAVMDMNPFYLTASAIVAVTAALIGMALASDEAKDYSEDLSYASRQQAEELEALKAQYDEVCETYGETSDQAYDLEVQIDYLTDKFEASKQTVGEYISEIQDMNSTWNETLESNRETYEAVETNEAKTLALVRQLERLATQQDITTESEAQMKAIIQELNKELPTLNLNYEDVIANAGNFAESVESLVKAQAATQRYEAAMQGAIDAQGAILEAQPKLDEMRITEAALIDEVAEKQEAYNRANEAYYSWINQGGRGNYGQTLKNDMDEAKAAYESASQELEGLQGEIKETEGTISSAQAEYDDYIDTIVELGEATANAFESAKSQEEVINAMATAVQELAQEYNDAYNAAFESFNGQFGLFDEAKANMDSTVANAQAALDSQLAYWDNYLANVNVLKETSASDLGVTQENYNAIMTYVQSGSAEAAGLAQSMVDAINSGNSEAITKLADTVGEVQSKREEAVSAVAEWQIDFNGKMDEIVQKAEKSVSDMNLSDEATAAASATINAYADAILAQGGKAIANAQSIANQVKSALSNANVSVAGVKGYASGTDYATPGPHLVGENGPEIIEFRGGEKVYTNEETERIMARSAAVQYFSQPEGGTAVQSNGGGGDAKSGDTKTIRLEINGAGAIEVNSDVDEETVVAIMQQNLKPVLTSIVRQEIYEEGDNSYDY